MRNSKYGQVVVLPPRRGRLLRRVALLGLAGAGAFMATNEEQREALLGPVYPLLDQGQAMLGPVLEQGQAVLGPVVTPVLQQAEGFLERAGILDRVLG
ncbi:MAG: hypothetical protein M3296_07725 [Actinomycetota bacterium]|nr:hypothetical protein [Actinomycetota bacterium]